MASNENDNDAPQVYLLGKTYLANNQGQFYIRNDPIVHMAAGDRHTIIVTETGRAFAFGDNSSGQLGLGHANSVEKVSCIKSLKFSDTGEKVVLVACGCESSLVATNHGSLYVFGSNSRSQLGIETPESTFHQTTPVKIDSMRGKHKWKQISMGAEHACALDEEGVVFVWGANDEGQCGQPKKIDMVKKPQELRMTEAVSSISCGYYHTALVTEAGRLFVLGSNDDRQLGRTIKDKYDGPEEVTLPSKVKAVACGHQHTVVLTENGQVYIAGLGDRGQLGLGSGATKAESFEQIEGLPKHATAIAAGEAHTAVIGNRKDIYVFGDGKHGKLGSTTYSNEFQPCSIEKFRNYNVLKVVCGGCQTIVLAQKKSSSDPKKSSGSEEDIGNATLSVTQRPQSLARSMRSKNLANRSIPVSDSMDSTKQHVRPLGQTNNNLRIESDDDKSEKELSESLKSATFNQTHTISNGRFRPTQSPSLNRTGLHGNDDDSRLLKTGALDRTVRLNKDADDLSKTGNRLPSLDKSPNRNSRFDRDSSPAVRKRSDSDDDRSPIRGTRFDRTIPTNARKKQASDEDKSPSEGESRPSRKKPDPVTSTPARPERKRSPVQPPVPSPISARKDRKPSPPARRQHDTDSEDDRGKRSVPAKTSINESPNRKPQPKKRSEDDDDDDDDDDDEEDEKSSPRKFNRSTKQAPPIIARRGSLPQTRPGASGSTPRDGNQTIGSRPVDGVRGSFRAPATKTLAKPTSSDQANDSTKKETPTPQPGFFARLFGSKATPPPTPPPPPPPAATPANANSRTCSVM